MKIGIFGGSFNPPHNGHVNSLTTVQKKMGFDLIHINTKGRSFTQTHQTQQSRINSLALYKVWKDWIILFTNILIHIRLPAMCHQMLNLPMIFQRLLMPGGQGKINRLAFLKWMAFYKVISMHIIQI